MENGKLRMDIAELIQHPEHMDRDTLYELRSLLALYPYYQTARLLMLQNLFLLHDPTFNEELRRAAIYITNRQVIFQMIEAGHYMLHNLANEQQHDTPAPTHEEQDSRTISLIDDFLDSLPKETEEIKPKRKPTPADAAVDYVAYLLESETEEQRQDAAQAPKLIGHSLIDSFIEQDRGKIVLSENPLLKPDIEPEPDENGKDAEKGYFTETLARIYIKQGNYSKALEIIQQLSLHNPKKNAYFADQIRFLQKLIINSNQK